MSDEFIIMLGDEPDEEQTETKSSGESASADKQGEAKVVAKDKSQAVSNPNEEFVVLLGEEGGAESTQQAEQSPAAKPAGSEEFVLLLDADDQAEQKQRGQDEQACWRHSLVGEETIERVKELYQSLLAAPLGEVSAIQIDAAEVEHIDTAVMQMLVYFSKHAAQRGVEVSFAKPSSKFVENLKMVDFDRHLKLAA